VVSHSLLYEIFHQRLPRIGKHTLGVELDTFDFKLSMTKAHDRAAPVSLGSPSADFQIRRQTLFFHDERVVPRGRHRHGQPLKDCPIVVDDGAGLAVHQMRRADDFAPERFTNRLMSQADSKDRNLPGDLPNEIDADPCFVRRAGARRDNDLLRVHSFNVFHCHLVVAAHFDLFAKFSNVLDEVVGERIVVVEDEYQFRVPAITAYNERRG